LQFWQKVGKTHPIGHMLVKQKKNTPSGLDWFRAKIMENGEKT